MVLNKIEHVKLYSLAFTDVKIIRSEIYESLIVFNKI